MIRTDHRLILKILVAASALVLGLGCGLLMLIQSGTPVYLTGRVSRVFPTPAHRVALATFEVVEAEFPKNDLTAVETELTFDLKPGWLPLEWRANPIWWEKFTIPPDAPAFVINASEVRNGVVHGISFATRTYPPDYKDKPFVLERINFELNAKAGRWAWLVVTPRGDGKEAELSINIGLFGDAAQSRALLDKVADRLAKPVSKPGSPEENDAIAAMINTNPGVVTKTPAPPVAPPAPIVPVNAAPLSPAPGPG